MASLLSDLTECESDESSVAGKGKKPAKKTGWRVKKALQPTRATTYTGEQKVLNSYEAERVLRRFANKTAVSQILALAEVSTQLGNTSRG